MNKENTYTGFISFFILYFFLNNLLLPEGLLFTTLLTPVFIYWLYKNGNLPQLMKWAVLLIIPLPLQWSMGNDVPSYIKSLLLILSAFVFLFTAGKAVQLNSSKLKSIFKTILIINSVMVVAALIILPFPFLRDILWNSIPISPDVPGFPRLKLLAYEPSHYALLLSPVFIYFILKTITNKLNHPLLVFFAVALPLLLSLSFGVLGALVLSITIVVFIFFKKLPAQSRRILFYSVLLLFLTIAFVMILWPENPVMLRVENIMGGRDTSAKGRLYESFMFAFDLAKNHNLLFGVGPGQTKLLAHDFIVEYYAYTGQFADTVRIPNSMGEMLATFGLYGLLIKIFIEIYFFIKLKIYRNMYSLALFLFIFIYQFTGSFLMNVAELGIWALVYHTHFTELDYDQLNTAS